MKAALAGACLAAVVLAGTGCSKSPTPGGAGASTTTSESSLPFVGSPSQPVLAEAAALTFPTSVAGYRSVRVTANELDVSFTLEATDLDAFLSGSGLGTLQAKRIINHPSPVWDLNPSGTIQSAVSKRHGLERGAEVVVTDTDPASVTIRLVISR